MIECTRMSALGGVATAAVALLLGILVAAPSAAAQAGADQYIPAPGPDGTRSGSPAGGAGLPAGAPPASAATEALGSPEAAPEVAGASSRGTDGGIELPLAGGFPLTPFAAVIAGLLACGLLGRLVIAARRGRGGSGEPGGGR